MLSFESLYSVHRQRRFPFCRTSLILLRHLRAHVLVQPPLRRLREALILVRIFNEEDKYLRVQPSFPIPTTAIAATQGHRIAVASVVSLQPLSKRRWAGRGTCLEFFVAAPFPSCRAEFGRAHA